MVGSPFVWAESRTFEPRKRESLPEEEKGEGGGSLRYFAENEGEGAEGFMGGENVHMMTAASAGDLADDF